ncbi:MAG TPA: glycosyltransferase family 4 protein [Ilumatobacter sp.]|nr:glycosyltransferase family 4 protein [Ilumatobacter sp.]
MDRHVERCAVEIDRGRFDVVLACSLNPHGATAIGRCTRTPAALYIGEPYRRLYEAQPRLHWANPPVRQPHEGALRYGRRVAAEALKVHERGIQAREERDNAAAFDRILVNSHFSREAVLRTYGLDATVCYLGVDTERFVPRPGFKRDVVLGVGAIIPEKNVELIIRALALIPARPPLVWLANIAKPSYLTKMQALAASARVRFVPRIGVAENEALELIQSARALVYAPNLEPFGLAVLEASACATPVVAVAEAGVRETVIHGVNGLLAEHDAEALACALSRVLDDDALACGLGAGGRRLVEERWTLAHAADRIERQLRLVARHT